MSILSALTGRMPEEKEIGAAMAAEVTAQKTLAGLIAKSETLRGELASRRGELGSAIFKAMTQGDTADEDRLSADIAKLETEATRVGLAIRVARENFAEAQRQRHLAGVQEYIRNERRQLTRRQKYTDKFASDLTATVKSFHRLNEINDLIISSWPTGTAVPDGILAKAGEFLRAVERELARVDGVAPLSDEMRFPGASRDPFLGDLSKLPSLADEVRQANARILEMIEAGPQGADALSVVDESLVDEASLTDPDPDTALLSQTAPSSEPADAPYVNPHPTELTMPEARREYTIHNGSIVNE